MKEKIFISPLLTWVEHSQYINKILNKIPKKDYHILDVNPYMVVRYMPIVSNPLPKELQGLGNIDEVYTKMSQDMIWTVQGRKKGIYRVKARGFFAGFFLDRIKVIPDLELID